ncbi:hypothetical protein VTK56DRAFT_7562 [Thermocarpiscus australiensis]
MPHGLVWFRCMALPAVAEHVRPTCIGPKAGEHRKEQSASRSPGFSGRQRSGWASSVPRCLKRPKLRKGQSLAGNSTLSLPPTRRRSSESSCGPPGEGIRSVLGNASGEDLGCRRKLALRSKKPVISLPCNYPTRDYLVAEADLFNQNMCLWRV